ncbi:MAG: radical SAM protein [Deltaproteobacteria bacterium]|nr:radical SAM protein [Deltaproteobacteria bacterium]
MAPSHDDPGRVGIREMPRLVALHQASRRRRQLMAEPDLTYLFWESTLRCNLKCAHCGSSCEATSPVDELSTEQVIAILRTIGEDFDASRIFVSITGGEPLLRKDLYEVVAEMTRLGMMSCIVTNGTLLTPERARLLVDAGMRTVSVSIDGLEPEHEAIRGEGSYDRALAGIAAARQAGMVDVEAITCVRAANLDSLPEVERVVRQAGANLWRLITVDTMGRLAGARDSDLWLSPQDVRRTFDFLTDRRRELQASRESFDVQFSCGGFLGAKREEALRPIDSQCFAGLCVGSILCDGRVAACPSLPRSWAQGSALENRFSAIWRTQFHQHRTVEWRRTGPCTRCDWFDLCLGGGLHERVAQPETFCWLHRQQDD